MGVIKTPMKTKLLLGVIALLVCFSFPSAGATRTLTINASGNGTVTRNPTNSAYPNGVVVTLTAVPGSNWVFTSWSGDLSGTANPVNVIMDADKVINATFTEIPTYQLTVLTTGAGFVSPSSGTYVSNSSVVMAATPSSGWVFTGWSGDLTGTGNPANLTMSGPKTVTATFGQLPAITAQPQSTSVSVGSTANFNVTAIGGSLQYEWHFAGSLLAGADQPSLTIPNVQSAHAGDYYVVVRNSYGVTTSQVATLTVDCAGTNVVSVCTDAALRQAVEIGGTVRICCNGTITLTNQIEVAKDTVIDASGQSVLISGNNQVRLFNVATGVTFVVSNAILANGRHTGATKFYDWPGFAGRGAAIQSLGGYVQLYSVILSNNVAIGGTGVLGGAEGSGFGGAVFCAGGSLLLQNVMAVSNLATLSGANSTDMSALAGGGAIYIENAMATILNSTLLGNATITPSGSVPKPARAGAFYQQSGNALFSNCVISANLSRVNPISQPLAGGSTTAEGGALFLAEGTCRLENSRVENNHALGANNNYRSSAGRGFGGGIFNSADLVISSSLISSNRASAGYGGTGDPGYGGGLFNVGTVVVVNTTFAHNLVRGGNGGAWGTPDGFSGGSAFGAGAFNGGDLNLTNTTITANSASGGNAATSGALNGSAYGGGVFNTGTVTAVHCTFGANSVATGRHSTSSGYTTEAVVALGANLANTNGSISLHSSLLADSGTNGNAWGVLIDAGYNISSDGTANFSSGSSFNFTDPKVLPLANNGGLTPTMALADTSPAIDWAPAAGAPATDQRGSARPYGDGADVGAFEVGPPLPRVNASSAGSTLRISFNARAGMTYRIERSADLITWQTVETITTEGVVARDFARGATKAFYRVNCSW